MKKGAKTVKMALKTCFTRAFDLSSPIVGAPMAGVSGPSLTAAVARSGGLGLLGAARYTEPQLRKFVKITLQLLGYDLHIKSIKSKL